MDAPRPNRRQRKALAHRAVVIARDELLAGGVTDMNEARKQYVNPQRRSVRSLLRVVWADRATLRKLDSEAKRKPPQHTGAKGD